MTGAELKAWRVERGLSQAALAALLGIPRQQRRSQQLYRYESGKLPVPRVVELALRALEANRPSVRNRSQLGVKP